jgi:hypothetical protein
MIQLRKDVDIILILLGIILVISGMSYTYFDYAEGSTIAFRFYSVLVFECLGILVLLIMLINAINRED